MKAKKVRKLSHFQKQLLEITDRYAKETGSDDVRAIDVAVWALQKGLVEMPRQDIARQLAKLIANASRNDFIEDENGEPVRHRHPYKVRAGDVQLTFWGKMEDLSPEKMRLAGQWRLNGMRADAKQHKRDYSYFNKHYNPGDPIIFSYNLDIDLEEMDLPTEYIDDAPEDEEPDND